MANMVLFQWGPIQFQVYPMNVGEMAHHTGADWAKKEIAGAAMYREWVGEGDEAITLKGKVFPHFFARHARNRNINHTVEGPRAAIDPNTGMLQAHVNGDLPSSGGLYHLEVLDNMRRMGQAHVLIRGDGWHFGWFIIESLDRSHSMLAMDGIGQSIEFDAKFQRVPIPNDPAENLIQIYSSGAVK